MSVRSCAAAAVLAIAALPLAGCYIGPAGRIRPAPVYVRPAPVYVRPPPPVVVVPRPYGY